MVVDFCFQGYYTFESVDYPGRFIYHVYRRLELGEPNGPHYCSDVNWELVSNRTYQHVVACIV